MSVKEIKASKIMKPCTHCGQNHEDGEPALEFDSNGPGRNTTINRVCIHCLIGIVDDYRKKKK